MMSSFEVMIKICSIKIKLLCLRDQDIKSKSIKSTPNVKRHLGEPLMVSDQAISDDGVYQETLSRLIAMN